MRTHSEADHQVYRLHADICSTLANPKRLQILNTLREKELSAAELLARSEGTQSESFPTHGRPSTKRDCDGPAPGHDGVLPACPTQILKAFDLMRELPLKSSKNSSSY